MYLLKKQKFNDRYDRMRTDASQKSDWLLVFNDPKLNVKVNALYGGEFGVLYVHTYKNADDRGLDVNYVPVMPSFLEMMEGLAIFISGQLKN